MGEFLVSRCIEEVNSCRIGGVTIGYKDNGLICIRSPNGLSHCNNSRKGIPGVSQMVSGNLQVLGRDEQKDIVLPPHDLDVGLIPCTYVIYRSLVLQVEAMAVKGSCGCIVEHGLVGKVNREYGSEYLSACGHAQAGKSCLSGT